MSICPTNYFTVRVKLETPLAEEALIFRNSSNIRPDPFTLPNIKYKHYLMTPPIMSPVRKKHRPSLPQRQQSHNHSGPSSPLSSSRLLPSPNNSPPNKKRRTDDNSDDDEGLSDLMRLYQMAKSTVSYCETQFRKLDKKRKHQTATTSSTALHSRKDKHLKNKNHLQYSPNTNNQPYVVDTQRDTIGGIPRKFLDLSHFPTLEYHVITDENNPNNNTTAIASSNVHTNHPKLSLNNKEDNDVVFIGKQPSNRIQITNAPLSHVNGTYIQDGMYKNSPLYVRVGPPRKFMGKFDCRVVLRREGENNNDGNSTSSNAALWKIGLVPSHTITHPRLIGYYEGVETSSGEPPVGGWKVGGRSKTVGGLKILYEE